MDITEKLPTKVVDRRIGLLRRILEISVSDKLTNPNVLDMAAGKPIGDQFKITNYANPSAKRLNFEKSLKDAGLVVGDTFPSPESLHNAYESLSPKGKALFYFNANKPDISETEINEGAKNQGFEVDSINLKHNDTDKWWEVELTKPANPS